MGPGPENPVADGSRFFAPVVLGEVFVFYGRNLDVEIDPVEQRTGDAGKITLDQRWRTVAFVQGVAKKTARVRIHILAPHARSR